MPFGSSKYVKVINEDGASVTTKVAVKQLCYISIMSRVQQMRWHEEWIHDSEDVDIMSHPMNAKAWQTLDCSDAEAW
jgi:hypothetical protein